MNIRNRLIQFSLIVLLVWAALTVYVIHRFSTDGCRFDQSLIQITAFGSLVFSVACAVVVMTMQALLRSLSRIAFKALATIATLGAFIVVSDQAVILAGETVLGAALPLLDLPTGMQTCLAWFTPNFLNGQAVLFRALMLAFIFSYFVSLVFFSKSGVRGHRADGSEKRG